METASNTAAGPAPAKAKKPRKKKANGKKIGPNTSSDHINGTSDPSLVQDDDAFQSPDTSAPPTPALDSEVFTPASANGSLTQLAADKRASITKTNGTSDPLPTPPVEQLQLQDPSHPSSTSVISADVPSTLAADAVHDNGTDAHEGLASLTRDRAALRDEVVMLRRSLEELQEKHARETATARESEGDEVQHLRDQLEDARSEKAQAESQYRNLMGKVNTIKSQLGERLKADAEDLAQARNHIQDLETHNTQLQTDHDSLKEEIARLNGENEGSAGELSSLRSRLTLAQTNWTREREDLEAQTAYAREEFDSARQAMQDWEVLALEERSIREGLGEKVADLEEQVATHREAHLRLEEERIGQSQTVEGLQRALQELQEARKQELREMVENFQAQVADLQRQMQQAQEEATTANAALETAQKEVARVAPFEVEAKEKNLLIGKLRHEAVILNDHLTKALKQLRRGKPDDTIDRQLITNHFLQFLALDRSDQRKFQVLIIIASLLGWTDEQREQAGLARPGASNPNLRTPISPWHRTPSTPSLNAELSPDPVIRDRPGSMHQWSDGLQLSPNPQASGASSSGRGSRSTSVSSTRR